MTKSQADPAIHSLSSFLKWWLLLLTLTACTSNLPLASTAIPTQSTAEIPEVAPADLEQPALFTPLPLNESTPAIVIEPPSVIPTPTDPPASVGVSQEELAIFSPGPGSMLLSPISVQGYGGPSLNNMVEMRLIGEDGRIISRGNTVLYSYPGRPGLFYGQVPFTSPALAEQAWLQVRSYGERYGLLKHLTTVPITLLTSGEAHLTTSLHGPEKITIFTPPEGSAVQGPRIFMQGAAWTDGGSTLGVEILDLRGTVLATAEVQVDAPRPGALGTFQLDLELPLSLSQWIRIAVFEQGGEIPGVTHYSSVQIWLWR
jgi:hypothetical protein